MTSEDTDISNSRSAAELSSDWTPRHEREAVFRQLFERHSRAVFYFFANRGLPDDLCWDLTQETFLGVYRSFQDFRQQSNFKTWLYSVTANVWRNHLRQQRTLKRDRPEVSLEQMQQSSEPLASTLARWPEEPAATPTTLDGLIRKEQEQTLRTALRDLPPRMRQCLLMRLYGGMKYREIASVLDVSVDTVKSQLAQARSRLRHELGVEAEP